MSGFRFVLKYDGRPDYCMMATGASKLLAEMWPRNSERREAAAHELADTGETRNGPLVLTDTEHNTMTTEHQTHTDRALADAEELAELAQGLDTPETSGFGADILKLCGHVRRLARNLKREQQARENQRGINQMCIDARDARITHLIETRSEAEAQRELFATAARELASITFELREQRNEARGIAEIRQGHIDKLDRRIERQAKYIDTLRQRPRYKGLADMRAERIEELHEQLGNAIDERDQARALVEAVREVLDNTPLTELPATLRVTVSLTDKE